MDTIKSIEKIRKNLMKLPSDKLQQLDDFLEFLLHKSSSEKTKEIKKLEGIWEGIGFEKIDIDEEISKLRTAIDTNLIGKSS